MMDLDGFKEWNDTYGHLEGDEPQGGGLRHQSYRTRYRCRCRYGGDEFCVLLPETPLDGALQLGERLRSRIARAYIVAGDRPASVTVSIGVFSPEEKIRMTPAAMVNYADAALRQAETAGKNRVCAHTAHSVSAV